MSEEFKTYVITYSRIFTATFRTNDIKRAHEHAAVVVKQFAEGECKVISIYAEDYVEPPKAETAYTKAEMRNLSLRSNINRLTDPPKGAA